MTRQLVGAVFMAVAAILYAARHLGAMMFMANKTGDFGEQYRNGLQVGGGKLLVLSVIALMIGVAYVLWGEYEARIPRR